MLTAAMATGEWKRRKKIAVVANVFKNRPKNTPQRNQACQPKTLQPRSWRACCVTRLIVTRKKGLLQLPQWGAAYATSTGGEAESLKFRHSRA
jgi:hypothetical protein